MKSILRTIAAVACILVLTFSTVLVLGKVLGRTRVDLTEKNLYTLSQGTRHILAELGEPIKLTLYYSHTAALKGPERIRQYNDYYLYVRDLLREYVRLSDGKLSLEVVDPRRFSEEEEEAVEYGLQRFPITRNEMFFFGLVARSELGKYKTIEFFNPARQEFVEYDISKLLVSVTHRDRKKVGVLSSLPVTGSDLDPQMRAMMRQYGRQIDEPWLITERLRETYEVVSVPEDTAAIDDSLDFLLLIHPKDLGEQTLFAIDQFVMRGGRLLVFVDPLCLQDQPEQDPQNPMAAMQHQPSSDLNRLLEPWGVRMWSAKVAADPRLAHTFMTRQGEQSLVTYLDLDDDQLNSHEVVTGQLHDLGLFFPGVLEAVPGSQSEIVELLSTSPKGTVWPFPGMQALQRATPEMIFSQITGLSGLWEGTVQGPGGDQPVRVTIQGGMGPRGYTGTWTEMASVPDTDALRPGATYPLTDVRRDGDTLKFTVQLQGPDNPEAPGNLRCRLTLQDDTLQGKAWEDRPGSPRRETHLSKLERSLMLGCRITGTLPSAFPEGITVTQETDPEAEEAGEAPATQHRRGATQSAEEVTVLVFADVDMLSDRLLLPQNPRQAPPNNEALLLNALDFLSGTSNLIAIRSRGRFERPFERVEQIEEELDEETRQRLEQLQEDIQDYYEQLAQLNRPPTDREEAAVMRTKQLQQEQKILAEIRKAQKERRQLQAEKREKVEALKTRLMVHNLLWAPAAVLLIALVLLIHRFVQARYYLARRR